MERISSQNRNKGRTITYRGKYAVQEALDRKHIENLRNVLDDMLTSKTLRNFIMILETRKIIESATVKLAAKNISEEELRKMKEILEKRDEHISKEESVSSLDKEFHSLLLLHHEMRFYL